ncbi:MAG: hypothetical protein MUF42_03575 [Cytophagaceae bacterium]|jgi:hypothetical protein|nr:hypothetical protein [Cytophagaceae bacterium]
MPARWIKALRIAEKLMHLAFVSSACPAEIPLVLNQCEILYAKKHLASKGNHQFILKHSIGIFPENSEIDRLLNVAIIIFWKHRFDIVHGK